jgi:hypothetical protein
MPILPPSRRRLIARSLALLLAFAALAARADCIDDAAARHQVNAYVLRAIGWQESGLQPAAVGHNANGSVDVGAFQINSVHLSELGRYGIARDTLADGCVSADVAAWHYRRQIERLGDGWPAVGAYHSRTAAHAAWYANQIAAILMRWHVMERAALPFAAERTLSPSGPVAGATPPPIAPPTRVSAELTIAPDTTRFSAIEFLSPAR